MLKTVAAAMTFGWLTSPLPAAADVIAQDAPVATVTVVGQGQVSRAPDLATVAANIATNDENATRALSENNRRYAALLTRLAAIGVVAGDVTSTSIQSYFVPRPSGQSAGGANQLFGYVVTRNVQINIRSLGQTGAAIDAATAAGATDIGGVTYGFHDRRSVEREALAAAVTDAYAQAQAIASAAHVRIVRILRIGNEAGPERFMPLTMSKARTADAPVPTTISPSDLDVTSTVSITYVIR